MSRGRRRGDGARGTHAAEEEERMRKAYMPAENCMSRAAAKEMPNQEWVE